MSAIVGARNTIDWLTGAWASIQASSSGTGIAILDAVSGKNNTLSDGLSISDGQNLAATFASIQQNLVQQQGVIAGQIALDRIKKQVAAATASTGVNKLV